MRRQGRALALDSYQAARRVRIAPGEILGFRAVGPGGPPQTRGSALPFCSVGVRSECCFGLGILVGTPIIKRSS